ncbi:unnamed protein product [Lactuca saligna]|uniref:OCRE domain-containing protein n=1 Tax=Lactuca saligna TaxID=75948 RepID=A0AA35ZDW6_LACSI|nr:unnamed protein product [Lactuca saligna]
MSHIKRRIVDVLQPGETMLQALRRLKGNSNRKEKTLAETKIVSDQLTEDAMKLMEDVDYNVYDEKQEVFHREAEGFENLVRARGEGTSSSSGNKQPNSSGMSDSGLNGIPSADNTTNNEDDSFDMFAEDDDKSTVDPSAGIGSTENDYVFDESSGYYYSSSLGYYYDPSSGLYCSAASGQWCSCNQETGVHVTKKPVTMRSCHQGKAMEMELQHSGMELESQVSHPAVRGTYGSFIQISTCLGLMGALLIGIPVKSISGWWRICFWLSTIPSTILALAMIFCAESPHWLYKFVIKRSKIISKKCNQFRFLFCLILENLLNGYGASWMQSKIGDLGSNTTLKEHHLSLLFKCDGFDKASSRKINWHTNDDISLNYFLGLKKIVLKTALWNEKNQCGMKRICLLDVLMCP